MGKKIKILACAYACQPTGHLKWSGPGEMILGWNMAKQIARFGEAHILTHSENRENIEQELEKNPQPGLYFYYIALPGIFSPLLRFDGGVQAYSYLWQIKAYFAARKLHKKIRFDLFHHITFANDWMASYIGAFLPVPFIRGPGGGAHKTPKEFLGEYSWAQRFWQAMRTVNQKIFRLDPVFLIGRRRAKSILLCNREAMEALPEKYRKKAKFFPVNGISAEDFYLPEKASGIGSGKFIVFSAGKLFAIKGFALGIRAFKIFSEKDGNVEFQIAGDGPEMENLKKLSCDLGIEDRVIFKKWLPRKKMLEELVKCDVFMFTSLRDGGGAVVVEAMALGKPVICLDAGGPGFHIESGWGIKIQPESFKNAEKELAASLEKLHSDAALRKQLGQKARERAKNYLWDKKGEELINIYKIILNEC